MADRIEIKDVTVVAGTTIATPVTFPMQFADGEVIRLEVRWPPGPTGLVGVQIMHSNQRVIPYRDDVWAKGDNETLDWELSGYPTGGAWAVRAYNLDIYDHSLELRWHVEELRQPSVVSVSLVPVIQESTAGDASVPNVDEPEPVFIPEPEPLPETEPES